MKMFLFKAIFIGTCICCNLQGIHDCITDAGNSPDGTLQVLIDGGRISIYHLPHEWSTSPLAQIDGDIAAFNQCGKLLAVWAHGGNTTRIYDTHTWQPLQVRDANGTSTCLQGTQPIFSGAGTAIALFSPHMLYHYQTSEAADWQLTFQLPFHQCIVHGDMAFLSHNQKTTIFDIWSDTLIAQGLPGNIRRVRPDGLLCLCANDTDGHYYVYRTRDGKIVMHGPKGIADVNLDDFTPDVWLGELNEGIFDPLCQ